MVTVPALALVSPSGGSVTVATPSPGREAPILALRDGSVEARPVIDGKPALAAASASGDGLAGSRTAGREPVPLGPVAIAGVAGHRLRDTSSASVTELADAALRAPTPEKSDLLTDLNPFDRAALERAIDRFLTQCEDLSDDLSQGRGPTGLVTEILALAVALTTAKVGLKLLGRPPGDDSEGDGDACVGLSLLPVPLDL